MLLGFFGYKLIPVITAIVDGFNGDRGESARQCLSGACTDTDFVRVVSDALEKKMKLVLKDEKSFSKLAMVFAERRHIVKEFTQVGDRLMQGPWALESSVESLAPVLVTLGQLLSVRVTSASKATPSSVEQPEENSNGGSEADHEAAKDQGDTQAAGEVGGGKEADEESAEEKGDQEAPKGEGDQGGSEADKDASKEEGDHGREADASKPPQQGPCVLVWLDSATDAVIQELQVPAQALVTMFAGVAKEELLPEVRSASVWLKPFLESLNHDPGLKNLRCLDLKEYQVAHEAGLVKHMQEKCSAILTPAVLTCIRLSGCDFILHQDGEAPCVLNPDAILLGTHIGQFLVDESEFKSLLAVVKEESFDFLEDPF